MAYYVGLDVSVKETSICIMDDKGVVAARTDFSTAPDLIAGFISKHAPKVERVVHESGILAIWLKMLEQTTNHTRHGSCSVPDDHIDPRRSAFFMARSVLEDIRKEKPDARSTA